MAHPVYSRRFICHAGLSGRGESVTVPPGRVYVVREVTIYCSTLTTLAAFFEDDTTGAALFASRFTAESGGSATFYGALVFAEGEGFHFQVNNAIEESADVYAGGYDLSADGS